jgi:hypothetical protein
VTLSSKPSKATASSMSPYRSKYPRRLIISLSRCRCQCLQVDVPVSSGRTSLHVRWSLTQDARSRVKLEIVMMMVRNVRSDGVGGESEIGFRVIGVIDNFVGLHFALPRVAK